MATVQGGGGSRPSKTNCTTTPTGAGPSDMRNRAEFWKQKNAIVSDFLDRRPARATRPLSVREGTKLREEASRERAEEGSYRSKTWSQVLREFLTWYNDYRWCHLKFVDPDGNEVRSPMQNSHQPRYGNKYYAKIKALEREMVKQYDNPHTAMLTFSGSSQNAEGGWRCMGDHLRDVVNTWRPDRGRGVYDYVRDALDGMEWCYAAVIEKHESGYGHVHVAIFADGELSESMFHKAMDTHIKLCDCAHRDAHDYFHENPEKRPISVKSVDTDLDRNADDVDDENMVANLGSYLGEYIGAHGEELLERDVDELMFRAGAWATGTQLVRFSTRANELIEADRGEKNRDLLQEGGTQIDVRPPSDGDRAGQQDLDKFDGDEYVGDPGHDGAVTVHNAGWDLKAISRVDAEGETDYERNPENGVVWNSIEGAEHLDPPKNCGRATPIRPSEPSTLGDY